MKVINSAEVKPHLPEGHSELSVRKWHVDETMAVGCVSMAANGGVKLEEHESSHVFYILKGAAKVFDGKDYLYAKEGDSVIIEPYEPHAMMGDGEVGCDYLFVTSPPK